MYAKLYSSILNSSLWSQPLPTRIAFITLLALADREGFVYGSPVGLARVAGMGLEEFLGAIDILSKPDPYTSDSLRNPEHEGRRIEAIEAGGWRILNYPYYRSLEDADERRYRTQQRVAKFRASKAVTPGNAGNPSEAYSESPQMQSQEEEQEMQATLPGVPAAAAVVGVAKVRVPKAKGTRGSKPPVYLNPPTMAEVEEFVRLRYPKANAKDFAFRFVRKQTEIEWRDKQGRPLRNWKATVDNWMDFEEVKG